MKKLLRKLTGRTKKKKKSSKKRAKKKKSKGYKCSRCGKSFSTKRGLSIHKSKAH